MIKPQEQETEFVVGLDVGTGVIRAVVAEVHPDRTLNVLGVGTYESKGMKKGAVTDVEEVVKAIKMAINHAESAANIQINSVYCSISGQHIKCKNERGMVSISNEVTQDDIEEAVHNAQNIKLPDECNKLLHAVVQNFTIDNQTGIKKPIGMTGYRLEAFVHLIACHSDAAKNLEKCIEKVHGIRINSFVFGGLASSKAVLTQDEEDIGVCVVDIGAGTIDISVYNDGMLRYSDVFQYAGYSATKDLAIAISTPVSVAEKLKTEYGTVNLNKYKDQGQKKKVSIKSVSGKEDRELNLEYVPQVLQPRYKELLENVRTRIKKAQNELEKQNKHAQLGAGIVFTGGGAKMDGLLELAKEVFNCPVRIGQPSLQKGLYEQVNHPEFSTVVGLLMYGCQNHEYRNQENGSKWWTLKSIYKKLKEVF